MVDGHGGHNGAEDTMSPAKRPKLESESLAGSPVVAVAHVSRADRGRIRGRRGLLKLVTEMPFDILHEIFGQLDPIDLLHLSWSTKTLNGILMARNARFLWINAFERLYKSVNPPPVCPPGLNLAQYTLFLFGKRCMECELNLGNHRSWSMRLRICRHCLHSTKFVRASKFQASSEYPWWGLAHISSQHGIFFLKADHDKVREKLVTMDRELLAQHQEEWRQKCEAVRGDELAYETWIHNKRQERKEELCSLKAQRREAILEKLNNLGWDDLEICTYALANSFEYSKPKPLTQKEWNSLQPILIERLEGAKAVIHKRRHKTKILFRLEILQQRIDYTCRVAEFDNDERPFPEDISILEPFKSSIFSDIDTEPECLFMDDSQFIQIVTDWYYERKRYISSLLPQELVEDVDGNQIHDPLSLEVAYFCGNGDTTIQYYYQAVCRVRQAFGEIPRDAPAEVFLFDAGEFRRPWYWDRDRWTFDTDRYIVATNMMIYLGMDPSQTRPGDFLIGCDNIRLQCIQCKPDETGDLQNCWSAMQHELQCHKDTIVLPCELKWRVDPQ